MCSIPNLEMLFPMNFYCCFVLTWVHGINLAWLPKWHLWATPVICIFQDGRRMPSWKITFERHIIECCIVPYLCMYLVYGIHFWCYFFNSRTNTAVICIFQDGRRIPSRKITFERHTIECCIIPHLYMYLVCRINFWCYFFNSRSTLAVIYIFQDGHQIQNGV